jgi:NADH-quinone oxidoreductase subunit C
VETSKIAEKIKGKFGDAGVELQSETIDPFIVVPAEKIADICRFLRDDPEIHLNAFSSISGVDWPEEGLIDVVYHLASYKHHNVCVLKVRLSREKPEVPTIEGVWKAANWFERETFDLLGVIFTGHSNLKRLLLPDDWEGYPLRKDYEEQPSYHGMETTREDPMQVMKPAPWGPAPEPPPEKKAAEAKEETKKDGEGQGT